MMFSWNFYDSFGFFFGDFFTSSLTDFFLVAGFAESLTISLREKGIFLPFGNGFVENLIPQECLRKKGSVSAMLNVSINIEQAQQLMFNEFVVRLLNNDNILKS
jgi:hypothetical protein